MFCLSRPKGSAHTPLGPTYHTIIKRNWTGVDRTNNTDKKLNIDEGYKCRLSTMLSLLALCTSAFKHRCRCSSINILQQNKAQGSINKNRSISYVL